MHSMNSSSSLAPTSRSDDAVPIPPSLDTFFLQEFQVLGYSDTAILALIVYIVHVA